MADLASRLFDFTGKTVLVTGGSRGLGYQMVKAFGEQGADTIIVSRKLDDCEEVAEEVAHDEVAHEVPVEEPAESTGPQRLTKEEAMAMWDSQTHSD